MSKHTGEHARFGATDVCPFVPVSGATMEDCAEIAREVGQRIGEELGIPVYLYEQAASIPERQNLAKVRSGEYEGLPKKLADPDWKPDFGPADFNPKERGNCGWRPRIPDRLQHQPEHHRPALRQRNRLRDTRTWTLETDRQYRALLLQGRCRLF